MNDTTPPLCTFCWSASNVAVAMTPGQPGSGVPYGCPSCGAVSSAPR